jgi:hypothetical protein
MGTQINKIFCNQRINIHRRYNSGLYVQPTIRFHNSFTFTASCLIPALDQHVRAYIYATLDGPNSKPMYEYVFVTLCSNVLRDTSTSDLTFYLVYARRSSPLLSPTFLLYGVMTDKRYNTKRTSYLS